MAKDPTRARAPDWLRGFDRGMDQLAAVTLVGAELMLGAMLAINLLNIAVRNLGLGSLLWVAPWTGFLMVWCVFLAFFAIYRRGMDITLGFFVNRFGPGPNRVFQLISALCGLLVCAVLVLELPQILARQRGVLELVGLERYWLSVPMVFSAGLLSVHFLVEALALALGWRSATIADETEQLQW